MLIDMENCDMWIINGMKGLTQLLDQRLNSKERISQVVVLELTRLKKAMELLLMKGGSCRDEVDIALIISLTVMAEAMTARFNNVDCKIHKDCKKELIRHLGNITSMLTRAKEKVA